jgi:hypothetical protein
MITNIIVVTNQVVEIAAQSNAQNWPNALVLIAFFAFMALVVRWM